MMRSRSQAVFEDLGLKHKVIQQIEVGQCSVRQCASVSRGGCAILFCLVVVDGKAGWMI
jgi:hypothetical protein